MKAKQFLFVITLFFSQTNFTQTFKIDVSKAKVDYHFIKEKVEGTVEGMKASITFNANDLSKSKIEGTVDVSTLTSGNGMRDKHLKGKSYFDVDNFPTMHFTS